jgi:hypothetical protein
VALPRRYGLEWDDLCAWEDCSAASTGGYPATSTPTLSQRYGLEWDDLCTWEDSPATFTPALPRRYGLEWNDLCAWEDCPALIFGTALFSTARAASWTQTARATWATSPSKWLQCRRCSSAPAP